MRGGWSIMRTSLFRPGAVVVGLLLIHAALLGGSAYRHSPVVTEVGHLPAGISHWQFGRFDLYRVNPPLVRMIAALPVLLARPQTNWNSYSTDPLTRSETAVGIDFVSVNGSRAFWFYTLGRWACIPFSLLGAVVCCRWAGQLYGAAAGLAALVLWCFCPNILGNGALMMPDVPAAALGAAACYLFWRWLKSPTWAGSLAAGAVLGMAQLTKTTLVIFFPLWPLMWFVYRWRRQSSLEPATPGLTSHLAMLAAQLVVAVYVINLGYGFEGSGQRLGDYRFQSHALTGAPPDDRSFPPGNRFANTWFAALPVPLPTDYVQGIDTQKVDFERGMRSYLRGQWRERGWWYYYLYGMTVKLPLGTLALIALATMIGVCSSGLVLTRQVLNTLRARMNPDPRTAEKLSPQIEGQGSSLFSRDELVVLLPLVELLMFVSSQTGFSTHFRYVLPVFPFLFIWASKPFQTPSSFQGEGRGEGQAGHAAGGSQKFPKNFLDSNEGGRLYSRCDRTRLQLLFDFKGTFAMPGTWRIGRVSAMRTAECSNCSLPAVRAGGASYNLGTKLFSRASTLALRLVLSPASYQIFASVLGVVLLSAAVLKFQATFTGSAVQLAHSRAIAIVLAECEICWGLWMLAGFAPHLTRIASVILFAGMGIISLRSALMDSSSCGCFGDLPVSPWTSFGIDVCAILGLLYFQSPCSRTPSPIRAADHGQNMCTERSRSLYRNWPDCSTRGLSLRRF
jgi:hypothetical protein